MSGMYVGIGVFWLLVVVAAIVFAILSRRSRRTFAEASEVKQAEARWINHNMAARAKLCGCGKPVTHVRRIGGNIGSVPVEIWSCAEHVNVNGWSRRAGEEHSTPAADFDDSILRWQVHGPREEST